MKDLVDKYNNHDGQIMVSNDDIIRNLSKECCLAIILEEPIRTVPELALDYFLRKQ